MLRVITLNLNGVRSAYRKGLAEWLKVARPDILCWQEVRAHEKDMMPTMHHPAGLNGVFVLPDKPGYSGVALFAAQKPQAVVRRFGSTERRKRHGVIDVEGRFVRMDFANFSVISLYMPSGSSGEARQIIKERVMKQLYRYLAACRREADESGRDFLLCGDINIAHTEKDIRNWRGNLNNSGFLPHERAWMTRLLEKAGWRDVFRTLNEEDGNYTWWSNRGRARENNVGWRIDYQLATPRLAARAKRVEIFTDIRFSDHAPLIVDYRGKW